MPVREGAGCVPDDIRAQADRQEWRFRSAGEADPATAQHDDGAGNRHEVFCEGDSVDEDDRRGQSRLDQPARGTRRSRLGILYWWTMRDSNPRP